MNGRHPKFIDSSPSLQLGAPDPSVEKMSIVLRGFCWRQLPCDPLSFKMERTKVEPVNNSAQSTSPDFSLRGSVLSAPQADCLSVAFCRLRGKTYPRRNGLQGGDVVLQSQAAAVIEHGFHSGHVCLHQLLSLVGCFLLQRFHFLLEMLPLQTHAHVTREPNKEDGAANSGLLKGIPNFVLTNDLTVIPTVWLTHHVLWVTALACTPSSNSISYCKSLLYTAPENWFDWP